MSIRPRSTRWSTIVRPRHELSSICGADTSTEPTDHYLRSFQWNKGRYRADRPLGELIENLQKEIQNIDNDAKAKFNQYNSVKTNLATLQRRQT
jgi:hypothetical protein